MGLTKEEYYRERSKTYPLEDPEALIRYKRAIEWMDLSRAPVVREVGCKYSVIRDLLRESSPSADYVAVDIDEQTLQKIPGYTPEQFRQHNANYGLPFAASVADYLICLEVLEHLEDATKFFTEASRVLKDSGRLIISVPNPYCWMELLHNIRRSPDQEGHIATYTHQNIDALSRFCGFEIEAVKGTFTRMPFSRRVLGSYALIQTDGIFATRSYMFLLKKKVDG
jgi:SAM-dependent methyltransferase